MEIKNLAQTPQSIMIVSDRPSFAQVIGEAFADDTQNTVSQENETFASMNGRAGSLVFDQDVVIFEADPDNETEVQAIEELLKSRTGETLFLALTDNDVSISKAQKLRKIGIDEVLPLSIDSDTIRSVVQAQMSAKTIVEKFTHDGPSARGQVISVTQARGGAGATTVAVNLATALANQKSKLFSKNSMTRIVLLDLDIQFGNANVMLDLEDNGGLLQLVESVNPADERSLSSALQTHPMGFDVLCAPVPVIPLQSLRADMVENILTLLQNQYDYIIVDMPRAVVDWVEPVIKCASQMVMVSDTSVSCVRQARRLIDLYREENVGMPIDVVINRETQPFLKTEHIREAEKVLETKLKHWLPDNPKVARSASDLGQPIVKFKPRSDLGKAFTKLVSAVSTERQLAVRNES